MNGTTGTQELHQAYQDQELLTPAQNKVLKAWAKWLGMVGFPVSRKTMVPKVKLLCGRETSTQWFECWLSRNPDITSGRPSGLDPKRAKAFNFATVHAHFEETIDINQLPPCNIYNFDEIGIQACGGRKDAGEEFFFSADDKSRSYS